MWQPSEKCEVCGSRSIEPAVDRDDAAGYRAGEWRCQSCGANCEEWVPVPKPGDRIVYRDDETATLVTATVLAVVTDSGCLEVRDEPWPGAVEGDTPWILPRLVVRNLTQEAEQALWNLTLEEKMVASVAVANYRKQQRQEVA